MGCYNHPMARAVKKQEPQIVLRDGEPSAVILDIETYRELLERAEDADDIRALEKMRRKPLRFRRLGEFLKEHRSGV